MSMENIKVWGATYVAPTPCMANLFAKSQFWNFLSSVHYSMGNMVNAHMGMSAKPLKLLDLFYFICIDVLPACVYVHLMHGTWYLQRPKEGIRSPGASLTDRWLRLTMLGLGIQLGERQV